MRAGAALLASLGLVLTACASAPEPVSSEPEDTVVETSAAPTEKKTEPALPSGAAAEVPVVAAAVPAPGTYAVAAGTTLRFVKVVAPRGKVSAGVWHGTQTAAAETAGGSTAIRMVWRPAATPAGTEQMGVDSEAGEVRTTADAVHLRLTASAYRAASAWQRALLLPPTPGRRWEIPPEPGTAYAATHCEVEAIETVATFAGDHEACARVGYDRAGVRTTSWWDAKLGMIRYELRDQRGILVSAIAVAGAEWPDRKTALALFGITEPAD